MTRASSFQKPTIPNDFIYTPESVASFLNAFGVWQRQEAERRASRARNGRRSPGERDAEALATILRTDETPGQGPNPAEPT